MAKQRIYLDEDPTYYGKTLDDIVVTAPSKYQQSYYSPWDKQWYGIGYGGKQVPIAMPTENVVSSPEEFMKYKQARAKQDDIGGWHQLGDQVENLMWTIMPTDASNALFDTVDLAGNIMRGGWHHLRHPIQSFTKDAKAIKDIGKSAYELGKGAYNYLNYPRRLKQYRERVRKLYDLVAELDKNTKLTLEEQKWDKLGRKLDRMRPANSSWTNGYVNPNIHDINLNKMTPEDIANFIDAYNVDPNVMQYYNPELKTFAFSSLASLQFNPKRVVTVGGVDLPNPTTGSLDHFYVPDNPLVNSNAKELNALEASGLQVSSNPISTNYSAATPKLPENYVNALKRNMNYMQSQLPGSKPFGSAATVADGQLYHVTNDIDFIMTEADAVKHADFKNWHDKGNGFGMRWDHPTMGPIDINIIKETADGKAYNSLAHELWSQQDPKGYAEYMKKYAGAGNALDTNVPLPVNSKTLYDNYDPVVKSIFDSFGSSKHKHVGRSFYFLNYADVDKLDKAFHGYLGYITGGNFTPNKIPLSAFSDPVKNAKYISELKLKGIDASQFVNSPERMKLLFDYATYDKTFLGRGVSNSRNILRDLREWSLGTGGSAKGVGLNTVIGGDSGYSGWGNVYGILQSKTLPKFAENTPEGIIKALNDFNTPSTKPLSSSQVDDVLNLAKKHNLTDFNLDTSKPVTLQEVLNATAYKGGKDYGNFFEELTDKFGVDIITNGLYGPQLYASAKNGLPVMQLIPNGMDVPMSRKGREDILATLGATGPSTRTTPEAPNEIKDFIRKAYDRKRVFGEYVPTTPYDKIKSRMDKLRWDKRNKLVKERRKWEDERGKARDYDKIRRVSRKLAKAENRLDNIQQYSIISGAGGALLGLGIGGTSQSFNVRKKYARINALRELGNLSSYPFRPEPNAAVRNLGAYGSPIDNMIKIRNNDARFKAKFKDREKKKNSLIYRGRQ